MWALGNILVLLSSFVIAILVSFPSTSGARCPYWPFVSTNFFVSMFCSNLDQGLALPRLHASLSPRLPSIDPTFS